MRKDVPALTDTVEVQASRRRLLADSAGIAVSALGFGFVFGLSAREAQILALVAQGMSNRQVGSTLSISEHTAANHMRSILRKTGAANRTEAAGYAYRHSLLDHGDPR